MFEFAGVGIRAIRDDDLENMLLLRAQPSVWCNLGDIGMISSEDQRQWFVRLQSNKTARYYVLYSQQFGFLGIVRTDEIDLVNRSMRVGGDIVPEYQGKGYGTKMFELLKNYCFNYLNMNRIWLLVHEDNEVARGLYHKEGFVEEGRQRQAIFRDGKYLDYVMMSVLKQEYSGVTDGE